MAVETWLLPVLWREKDWRAALARLATEMTKVTPSPQVQKSALALGRACEYIEPDRRRAIAAYELTAGHDLGRAREIAIELGWWSARGRLCAMAGLPLEEAEAWWDAGQPELAALALSTVRGEPEADLRALIAGTDKLANAERIAARGTADDLVMAARFAHPVRHLEAALEASPGHPVAARMLLDHALAGRDDNAVQRVVKARLAGLDGAALVDAMRATALALLATDHHRGFGRRLLRQALEAAYDMHVGTIPGHLAMWSALVQRAQADGNKRELLPFAILAIESSPHPIDHVWLGALATEISLDAGNPVVAGAYAEIVAEHAPEHPVVIALVEKVAASSNAVPVAAIEAAATAKLSIEIDIVDLADTYAEAVGTPVKKKPPPPPPKKKTFHPVEIAETAELPIIEDPVEPPPPVIQPPKSEPVKSVETGKIVIPAKTTQAIERPKSSIIPAVLSKPQQKAAPKAVAPKPVAPVLAALRVPDRPLIPPKAEPSSTRERARRISIPVDIKIELAAGKTVEGHSRDLSTTGLFVITSATLTVGTAYAISIMIPGAEAFSEDEYRAKARVVRREDGGYGIELITPDAKLIAALAAL